MSKMDFQLGKAKSAMVPIQASRAPRGAITLRDFFMPLAIIGALLVLVLTLGVHYAVRVFDTANEQREQALAHNGIAKRIKEVAQMVVPQADWDDAVTNLDLHFDPTWARAYIGSFLYQTDGFDRAFVIDRDETFMTGYVLGAPVTAAAYAPVAPLVIDLVQQVRAKERVRGAFQVGAGAKMISSPIQASALKLVDGHLAVMTATLVQPDFGKALPGARAPIVITTMPVDNAFLDIFSKRFLLHDLHVAAADHSNGAGQTSIAARDEHDRLLARLTWKPQAPGYALLRDMATPIALVSLALIALAAIQLRQIRTLAVALIEREAFWREVANQGVSSGLINRTAFVEQLDFEISCLGEVGPTLAVLDIQPRAVGLALRQEDQFRQIVTERLRNVVREEAVVAQLDGETFAILAVGAGAPGAKSLRQRILKSLMAPVSLDGMAIETAPLVGIAVVGSAAQDATAVLAQAAADGATAR